MVALFREAALKTFLFKAPKNYTAISLDTLEEMFQLPQKDLLKQVSKLILKKKVRGFLDMNKRLLVFDHCSHESLELHHLSLQYVERLETMVENNEKLLELLKASASLKEKKAPESTATGSKAKPKNKEKG